MFRFLDSNSLLFYKRIDYANFTAVVVIMLLFANEMLFIFACLYTMLLPVCLSARVMPQTSCSCLYRFRNYARSKIGLSLARSQFCSSEAWLLVVIVLRTLEWCKSFRPKAHILNSKRRIHNFCVDNHIVSCLIDMFH